MIVNIEIDTVENTLPVELHDKVPESDEFFRHYPPPFLFFIRRPPQKGHTTPLQYFDKYNYIRKLGNVNAFLHFFPSLPYILYNVSN